MKNPHQIEDVRYLMTMSTWPQASWSLRTDIVHPCDTTLLPHRQPIRELCTSWSQTLQPASLTWFLKVLCKRVPWWLTGKESTCQFRGHGFDSWSRKIPHVPQQLRPCAVTTEPMLWSPRALTTEAVTTEACALQQEKPPQWEAWTLQLESSPCSPQLEKTQCKQQRRPSVAKNK